MIQLSSTTADAARALWDRERIHAASPDSAAAMIEAACLRVEVDLGRWIGVDGYRALLRRAVAEAHTRHPAMRGLRCLGDGEGALMPVFVAEGRAEVMRGLVDVVALLIHLLGEVIGEDAALRLVEQAWSPERDPSATNGHAPQSGVRL